MTIKIENWSIVAETSPYTAPELLQSRLHGNIYEHPKFEDGALVTTSIITKADGWHRQ